MHSFEPWVKKEKWVNAYNQTAEVICISLEDNEDNCYDNHCNNHGTCYNGLSDYYCDCKCGWKGKDCNTGKPKCQFQKMGTQLINTSFQKMKHNLTVNWNAIPMCYQMKMKSFNPSF